MDEALVEVIRETIRTTVNGKIDKLSTKIDGYRAEHQTDMRRALPVIEAYEKSQDAGRFMVKAAGTVATLGGAYLVVKQLFPSLGLW